MLFKAAREEIRVIYVLLIVATFQKVPHTALLKNTESINPRKVLKAAMQIDANKKSINPQ